jgi:hypothetical protein
MQRLVYSPKAYIFIRRRNGDIADVSRYCTAGSVVRRVSAVSTANFTLRNPNMLFTAKGGSHASFFPMDPVTIYLQRLRGRPVRVFTGFLDDTPYYELYPGVIEFSASCTLKKLLYTYFDPALPYTQSFLAEYGWLPDANGGIYNPRAVNGIETDKDGGMGALLFATMTNIGHWNAKNIKIEALPSDLIKRMANMLRDFEDENKSAQQEIETLISRFIGAGDYGSSGGTTAGDGADVSKYEGDVAEILYQVGKAMGVSVKFMLAAFETGIVESGMKNLNFGDADSKGWRQERVSIYGDGPDGATNVNASAKRFYQECAQQDKGDSQTAGQLAADVQRPAAQYRDRYDAARATAVTLMEKTKAKVDKKDQNATSDPSSSGSDTTVRVGGQNKTGTVGKGTRLEAIIAEANRLTNLSMLGMPYSNFRPPNDTVGYDCSSSVSQLLKKAGYKIDGWPATSTIKAFMKKGEDPTGRVTFWNSDKLNISGNSVHIFATIMGRDWGTNRSTSPNGGPSWSSHTKAGFEPFHVPNLDDPADVPTNANTSVPGSTDSQNPSDSSSATGNIMSRVNATVLASSMQWASVEDRLEATALQGNKSLMNDKPLMPFIQQMAESSLRQFQSMPNGDFFAFYPDYFGETWHRPPYWIIDDIEVLDGKVRLNDVALVTHEYAIGDTFYAGAGSLMSKLFSAGSVSITNAFQSGSVTTEANRQAHSDNKDTKHLFHAFNRALTQDEAVQFLERYGARPDVQEFPFIRNPFYEMFMAYQRFMQAWSRQFLSPFKLTFMPELYPGGKVGFTEHGLQMYIEEVTHTWDYNSGFVTEADLSAPAAMLDHKGNPLNDNLPSNMPTALLEVANDKTDDSAVPNVVVAPDGNGQMRPN